MYVYDKEHLQLQHVHHESHRETYFAFHAKVYHDTRYSEPEKETKSKVNASKCRISKQNMLNSSL